MKPILVHVHIYYPNMWPELKTYIKNIEPHPFDLFVTMVQEHTEVVADIQSTFPNANIQIVENRGYDVGPFIHILNQVDLDQYSYVIKLHTKRDMKDGSKLNYFDVSGDSWRKYALSILRKDVFPKILNSFSQDSSLGMVSDYHLITEIEKDDKISEQKALELLQDLKMTSSGYAFVAGTMFVVRATLLKPIQQLNWTLSNFEAPDKKHSHSLAHIAERLFGCLVVNQGYAIKDVFTTPQYKGKCFLFFRFLWSFIYQKKITRTGKLIIKICKIPVYTKPVERDLV